MHGNEILKHKHGVFLKTDRAFATYSINKI